MREGEASFCPQCGRPFGATPAAGGGQAGTAPISPAGVTPPPPPPAAAPPSYAPMTPPTPPRPVGNGFSTGAIVCGAIAFLFFPIILGPVGLILAAVGKSKGEERANLGFVVAGLGLVVGMILGAAVFANSY